MRLDELIQQADPKQLLTQAVIRALQKENLRDVDGEELHQRVQSLINTLTRQYGQEPGPWLNNVYADVVRWFASRDPFQ